MQKIWFDDVEIPFPRTWQETSSIVEDVQSTEAGTDVVHLIRVDKISISVSGKCFSDQLVVIKKFAKMPSFTLTKYEPNEAGRDTRAVRMRDLSYSLVNKSWDVSSDVTQGIWEYSYKLEEF